MAYFDIQQNLYSKICLETEFKDKITVSGDLIHDYLDAAQPACTKDWQGAASIQNMSQTSK